MRSLGLKKGLVTLGCLVILHLNGLIICRYLHMSITHTHTHKHHTHVYDISLSDTYPPDTYLLSKTCSQKHTPLSQTLPAYFQLSPAPSSWDLSPFPTVYKERNALNILLAATMKAIVSICCMLSLLLLITAGKNTFSSSFSFYPLVWRQESRWTAM